MSTAAVFGQIEAQNGPKSGLINWHLMPFYCNIIAILLHYLAINWHLIPILTSERQSKVSL